MFQFYEGMFPEHSLSVDKFDAYIATKQRDGSPNPRTIPARKRIKAYEDMKKVEAERKREERIELTPQGLERRWQRERLGESGIENNVP